MSLPHLPPCFFFPFGKAKGETGRKEIGEGERARNVGKVEVERNQKGCKQNWREQEIRHVAEVKFVRKRVLEIFSDFQWGTQSYNSINFARTSLCTYMYTVCTNVHKFSSSLLYPRLFSDIFFVSCFQTPPINIAKIRTQATRCLHVLCLLLREIYSEINFEHPDMGAGNTADIQMVVYNSLTIRALLVQLL